MLSHWVWNFISAVMKPSSAAQHFQKQLRRRITGEQQRRRVVGADVAQNALVAGQVHLVAR